MVITTRKYNSKATKAIVPLLNEDMFAIDVGVSMGYQRMWREFLPKLTLHGFDPLVNEIARLSAEETNPNIHYHAAFVTPVSMDPMPERKKPVQSPRAAGESGFATRLASVAIKKVISFDQTKDEFNSGLEVVLARHGVALDDFFESTGREKVDFIKVDTDGHDYQVLLGARKIIEQGALLGVDVEVRFTGTQRDDANLFRNIDKLLGEAGFSLFHLEPKRYARAAMPRPFVNNRPTAADHGQYRWANAIYLRDIGAAEHERRFKVELSLDKILKAICLFDHFDLPDCAAEIVHKYRDRIASVIDPVQLLDLLTPPIGKVQLSYEDYMKQFEKAIELRAFDRFGREIL